MSRTLANPLTSGPSAIQGARNNFSRGHAHSPDETSQGRVCRGLTRLMRQQSHGGVSGLPRRRSSRPTSGKGFR
jgi:hypothetical protein